MIIRLTAHGMHGPLAVYDANDTRYLTLNNQVQGGSRLQPDASVVHPDLSGPGPVSNSNYTLGWLTAAALNPTGHGLMIGLGSGAGVVCCLFDNPGLTMTVVELDPTIVQMATQGFPLVKHYIAEGRLRVVTGDAVEWVALNGARAFDFICSDAYVGKNVLSVGGADFYASLKGMTPNLWINAIGSTNAGSLRPELMALEDLGWPVQAAMIPAKPGSPWLDDATVVRNWILTTQPLEPLTLDAYLPYGELDDEDEAVANSQAAYVQMITNEFSREQILALVGIDSQ